MGLFPWDVLNPGHSREICSPAVARFSAGCWVQHREGAAATLGREHNHLFPSSASTASLAANWDNSPRHKQLDKRLRPPRQGGRGGRQGRSKHSERLPTTGRTDTTPAACAHHDQCSPDPLPAEAADSQGRLFQGSPSSTHPPISAPRGSARHGRSYSSCTHLWLQTAASRSADSVNLCHLLPCLPGQLQ